MTSLFMMCVSTPCSHEHRARIAAALCRHAARISGAGPARRVAAAPERELQSPPAEQELRHCTLQLEADVSRVSSSWQRVVVQNMRPVHYTLLPDTGSCRGPHTSTAFIGPSRIL